MISITYMYIFEEENISLHFPMSEYVESETKCRETHNGVSGSTYSPQSLLISVQASTEFHSLCDFQTNQPESSLVSVIASLNIHIISNSHIYFTLDIKYTDFRYNSHLPCAANNLNYPRRSSRHANLYNYDKPSQKYYIFQTQVSPPRCLDNILSLTHRHLVMSHKLPHLALSWILG